MPATELSLASRPKIVCSFNGGGGVLFHSVRPNGMLITQVGGVKRCAVVDCGFKNRPWDNFRFQYNPLAFLCAEPSNRVALLPLRMHVSTVTSVRLQSRPNSLS